MYLQNIKLIIFVMDSRISLRGLAETKEQVWDDGVLKTHWGGGVITL